MKIRIFFLFLIFFVTSCSKEVSVDLPEIEPKTVIGRLFTTDRAFSVYVSKTAAILDNNEYLEKNANIILYENGQFFDTLRYDSAGWYSSNKIPSVEKNYEINLISPNKPIVSASDVIPEKTFIKSAIFKDSAIYNQDGYHAELDIVLTDNAAKRNYYELFALHSYTEGGVLKYRHVEFLCNLISDYVIKAEGLLNYELSSFVFSDELINGKSHEFKLYFYRYEEMKNSNIVVVLRSISEAMYNYKKKIIIHANNQQGEIWNGVGEPVNMYSNINNGVGIFAGYSFDTDTLFIP